MLEVQSAKRVEFLANKFDPSAEPDSNFMDAMSLSELKVRLD